MTNSRSSRLVPRRSIRDPFFQLSSSFSIFFIHSLRFPSLYLILFYLVPDISIFGISISSYVYFTLVLDIFIFGLGLLYLILSEITCFNFGLDLSYFVLFYCQIRYFYLIYDFWLDLSYFISFGIAYFNFILLLFLFRLKLGTLSLLRFISLQYQIFLFLFLFRLIHFYFVFRLGVPHIILLGIGCFNSINTVRYRSNRYLFCYI